MTQTQTSMESIQVEAIINLTKEIPTNDIGLPTGVYRTDLLPFHDYLPTAANDELTTPELEPEAKADTDDEEVPGGGEPKQNGRAFPLPPETKLPTVHRIAGFPAASLRGAFVPLQFNEGFPAFESGLPFWSRLEFEPSDAFEAFQRYSRMNLGHVSNPDEEEYDGKDASGTRSISALATEMHPDSQILNMTAQYQRYYHLYYWGLRARSYDLFRVAEFRQKQEFRAVETQDEHYVQSRRLRHRLMKYMDDEEDFWDLMTPKIGIDMLKTLTQLERISAGIPAAGPTDEHGGGGGVPFEVTYRTIAQRGRQETAGDTLTEDGEILDKALESPEVTEILQELVIRSGNQ